MEYNNICFFDTETTGIPERNAQWDVDYMTFPHVVQLAWVFGTREENHIIRPDGWTIPDETIEIHGITNEYAQEHGEPFAAVVDKFIQDCADAELICGHNIYFDVSIVKANILRELGREYYDAMGADAALFKGKRIDTMRPTMQWVDARNAAGRVKFPRLSELYAKCFNGETFNAHNALDDVKACARCLPVIAELGLVELKVKEYPDELPLKQATAKAAIAERVPKTDVSGTRPQEKAGNATNLGVNEKMDKSPVSDVKAPENENSAKITPCVVDEATQRLLDANDF